MAKESTFTKTDHIIKVVLRMIWSMAMGHCFIKIKMDSKKFWEEYGSKEIFKLMKKDRFLKWD